MNCMSCISIEEKLTFSSVVFLWKSFKSKLQTKKQVASREFGLVGKEAGGIINSDRSETTLQEYKYYNLIRNTKQNVSI